MAKKSGSTEPKEPKIVKAKPNPGDVYECPKHGKVEPYVCKTYRTCRQCAKDRRAAYMARKKAGTVGPWTASPDYWTKGPGKGQDGAKAKAAEAKARVGVEFAWSKPEGNIRDQKKAAAAERKAIRAKEKAERDKIKAAQAKTREIEKAAKAKAKAKADAAKEKAKKVKPTKPAPEVHTVEQEAGTEATQ